MLHKQIKSFEDIQCWQKARILSMEIYQAFSQNKDYGFKDQIQRAAVSVMNNIAEGFERNTNKEFRHFLYIAKGSCGEVRSMLYLAEELEYTTPTKTMALHNKDTEISKMLSGFIKTL